MIHNLGENIQYQQMYFLMSLPSFIVFMAQFTKFMCLVCLLEDKSNA